MTEKVKRAHSTSQPNRVRIFYIDDSSEERYARLTVKDETEAREVAEYTKESLHGIIVTIRGEHVGYITNADPGEDNKLELIQLRTFLKFRFDIVVRGKLEIKKDENGEYTAEIVLPYGMSEKDIDKSYFKH